MISVPWWMDALYRIIRKSTQVVSEESNGISVTQVSQAEPNDTSTTYEY